MASRHITELADDTDGTADGTVRSHSFSLDGVHYAIDLTDANFKDMRERLMSYIDAGRRIRAVERRASRTRTTEMRARSAQIRAWAQARGLEVTSRGRLPQEIVDQYAIEHP